MAVKTRARAILFPIVFYLVLGSRAAISFGARRRASAASKPRRGYDAEAAQLQVELAQLQDERDRWRRRVDSMRSEAVDRDLLDEEARAMLDRVGKDDVVIFTADAKAR